MNPATLPIKPRMSEKSYALSKAENTYAFVVPMSANKIDVKRAVEKQLKVSVKSVRVLSEKGKSKRSYHKYSRRFIDGQRSDKKKAYVTLKEGDKIPVFAHIEEAEAKEAKKKAKENKQ